MVWLGYALFPNDEGNRLNPCLIRESFHRNQAK
jgi:hypothetical protein